MISANELTYNDNNLLADVQNQLATLPTLIEHNEVALLHQHFINVFHGQAFIIQMGDCAERFADACQNVTHYKYEQLIFFKRLVERVLKIPVITVGRIAGQYAKPRSSTTEIIAEQSVYAYHGDMINAEHANNLSDSRNPDPYRMLQAYNASKKILLHLAEGEEKIFTSHECFLLAYEQPLTRIREEVQYNLSMHLPWLGMRNLESKPHVDYLSKIDNPVAIKIGPDASIASIVSVIQKINPQNQIGKIILIGRLGVTHVRDKLPKIIQVIKQAQLNVIWMWDPLHGNTHCDRQGKKYRLLQDLIEETIISCDILCENDIDLGGLHLEASYKTDILECVDSLDELVGNRAYDSALDPRLNHNQCIAYFNQVLTKISRC